MYNGDWDDLVPYRDTEKNLELIEITKSGDQEPWNVKGHHAGFYQIYSRLTLISVKGASHMVPQTKPAPSYQMFYNFIKGRPINTPVD
jgi:serine carboxypeptidase-like clade 1